MRGTLLVVDMNTGIAHLTAKGMPGGRVQSAWYPRRQSEPANARKPPKPEGGRKQ